MNRRNFFKAVGATVVGAIVGQNAEINGEGLASVKTLHLQGGDWDGFVVDNPWHGGHFTLTNDGMVIGEPFIRRMDGEPIRPGGLYFDDKGVLQVRRDDVPQVGFDWFSAWL